MKLKSFESTETLPYRAELVFDLVAAVDSYHEFMPLCERSTVVERSAREDGSEDIVAILEVAHRKSGLRSAFESTVHLDRANLEINATSRKGPVRHLRSRWTFHDLADGRSQARFFVEYEMSLLPLQILMSRMYTVVFERIATAFRERARQVYG